MNKLTSRYVILARDVTTDANDKSLSIIKIVDKIDIGINSEIYNNIKSTPDAVLNAPVTFAIATCFGLDEIAEKDLDLDIELSMVSPSGKELVKFSQPVVLVKNTDKVQVNMNMQGLPVNLSGRHVFNVAALNKGKELASGVCYLDVNVFEQGAES